jgi:hypothetical protein
LGFIQRLMHAWNAFATQEDNPVLANTQQLGASYSYRGDRTTIGYTVGHKTIVSAIYNRMSIDTALVPIRHVRLDDNAQYQEDIDSGIGNCLTVEANIDQGATAFRQDIVQSLFEQGVVAIVPIDTTISPITSGVYDINTMRVGRVMNWFPRDVLVRVYDDRPKKGGIQRDVLLPKSVVAIVENPLYTVMNDRSSTLQRLLRKLSLLDAVDEQSASGKLDIIIQLPYTIKTDARRKEADKRLKEIEFQLAGSKHGIAYTDGTEKIVQLNRPVENNLMAQIEYLTKMLYGQLGITEEVMNGTADEPTMINYYNRSIKPILAAICEAMTRTFLTKTARSQGQTIRYFRNPFDLVPVKDLAEIVDKFTRNEVASSNDMRSVIGWKPSKDPKADKLLNKNIPAAKAELPTELPPQVGAAEVRTSLPALDPTTRQGANSQNGRNA